MTRSAAPPTRPRTRALTATAQNYGVHPNARDRFMLGVSKHGLGRKDVHPCINWFKGVRIAADGATEPNLGPFPGGRAPACCAPRWT